jgi:hypothetical protein
MDRMINGTYRLPCLSVHTVIGCCKNALERGSASSGHKAKLEQSTFSLKYLWILALVTKKVTTPSRTEICLFF